MQILVYRSPLLHLGGFKIVSCVQSSTEGTGGPVAGEAKAPAVKSTPKSKQGARVHVPTGPKVDLPTAELPSLAATGPAATHAAEEEGELLLDSKVNPWDPFR